MQTGRCAVVQTFLRGLTSEGIVRFPSSPGQSYDVVVVTAMNDGQEVGQFESVKQDGGAIINRSQSRFRRDTNLALNLAANALTEVA
jgi:hypothetical protein